MSGSVNQDAVSLNLQMTLRETEHRPSTRPSVRPRLDALKKKSLAMGRHSQTELNPPGPGVPTPNGRPEIASRSAAIMTNWR